MFHIHRIPLEETELEGCFCSGTAFSHPSLLTVLTEVLLLSPSLLQCSLSVVKPQRERIVFLLISFGGRGGVAYCMY